METATTRFPRHPRGIARLVAPLAILLPSCADAFAMTVKPAPVATANPEVQRCLRAALPAAHEGAHLRALHAATFSDERAALHFVIDTQIEAYGAVYQRRLLCTIAPQGEVTRVAGRAIARADRALH